jgi:hypothetical protein
MRLLGWLPSLVLLPGLAMAQEVVTFQATLQGDTDGTFYRIAVQAGATPESVTALLDKIATQPGSYGGPLTVSPDGNWYVFHSGRFDAATAASPWHRRMSRPPKPSLSAAARCTAKGALR